MTPLKFPSKVDRWMVYLFFIVIGMQVLLMLYFRQWPGIVAMAIVAFWVFDLYKNTYYRIEGEVLHIKSSFIVNKRIEIKSIKSISPSGSMLSAPALSMDRLEILYNTKEAVLISPADKQGFIEALLKLNPSIKAPAQAV